MPTTAAPPTAPADPFKTDTADFSSVPIPEEDEGTETASEPLEPTTPTSHSSDTAAPFTHPFRHDEPVESVLVSHKPAVKPVDPKSLPSLLPPLVPTTSAQEVPPPRPITRTMSNMKSAQQPDQSTTAPPEKPGLSKRVGSFMRRGLHRTPSHKDKPAATAQPETKPEKLTVNAGPDDSSELSIPAAMPKYRRLSSFSLSARNSPRSSHGNSPPSPSSPTSTISDEQVAEAKPKLTQKQSASSAALSGMNSKRPAITWAGGGKEGKRGGVFTRRRSASSEQVPRARPNDEKETVGLIDTFSKAAPVGVGMKARRLSLSLPDEFVVDSCELDKEFKSSSLMPGKRGKRLGQGATAEVRIMARRGAFSKEDLVAVKEFREREKDETEDDYIKKIKSEYSIAKSLHHPNIVETVRLCTNRGRWNHVMEFCSGGELFTLVERKLFVEQGGYYSSDDRLCFFKQLLRGVDYLHSHGIAHRDIKLENLLLSKEGHLKISDFGVAEVFCGEHPGLRAAGGECGKNMGEVRLSNPGICGSLPYIAPEVLEKKSSYDPRPLDVWSCAIVYLTMTFGGCPWQAAKTEFEFYAKFKKGWDEWLDGNPDREITDGADGHPKCGRIFGLITSPAVKRLILKMLHPVPEKRLTIRQVINTSIYKSWGCCCPDSYDDPACCFDTTKCPSKQPKQITKKLLHHHIPPKPENKIALALQHRFDMGDGWS